MKMNKYQLRISGFPGMKDNVAIVFEAKDYQDAQKKAVEAWRQRHSTDVSALSILQKGVNTNITLERIGKVLDKCWDPRV